MSDGGSFDDYKRLLQNDDSVEMLRESMGQFQRNLFEAITSHVDFTLRLEIHGNQGEVLHYRVHADAFRRPPGVEKRIEKKGGIGRFSKSQALS